MDFTRETLFDVIEEIEPLLQAHHQECTLRPDLMPLEAQWQEYQALEALGLYVIFTARQAEALAGYASFFVNRHLHSANFTVAVCDVLYLDPEHRRGDTAQRFIEFAAQGLKAMGARKVGIAVPVSQHWSPILHRMGFADEETVCTKFL